MLLNAREVATMLRVRPERVYELARTGGIPTVRIGRQVRFHVRAIEEWAARGGHNLVPAPHATNHK